MHGHLSELDPVKRSLVTAVCARAGCPVRTGQTRASSIAALRGRWSGDDDGGDAAGADASNGAGIEAANPDVGNGEGSGSDASSSDGD